MSTMYMQRAGRVADLFPSNVFVRYQGRKLDRDHFVIPGTFVTVTARLFGGKGGYGQLLKDFGKETALSRNKKSMRDLSGRMIRDLDDMEDFRKWLISNPERKRQLEDEKVKRLKQALIEPKHFMDSSNHYKTKDLIEQEQTSALQIAQKRKAELDQQHAAKEVKRKKKKWYESDTDDEKPGPSPISVRQPSEIRNQQLEEKRDQLLMSKFGAITPIDELQKPKFQILSCTVCVAPVAKQEIQKEVEIWEEDYLDTNDPEIIAQYKIEKRERLYRENLQKQQAAQKDNNGKPKETTPKVTASEVDYKDVNLEDFKSESDLKQLGMDYIKALLQIRGLKCGGMIDERVKRLFSVKGLSPEHFPRKIRAKTVKC